MYFRTLVLLPYSAKSLQSKIFAHQTAFTKKFFHEHFVLPKRPMQQHGILQKYFSPNLAFWPICGNFAPRKFHTIWYMCKNGECICCYNHKLQHHRSRTALAAFHISVKELQNSKCQCSNIHSPRTLPKHRTLVRALLWAHGSVGNIVMASKLNGGSNQCISVYTRSLTNVLPWQILLDN